MKYQIYLNSNNRSLNLDIWEKLPMSYTDGGFSSQESTGMAAN